MMDEKEKDTLDHILSSPSRIRESYVINNYPTLYNKITEYNNFEISFKEKLWYYYNNIKERVLCKCGNTTSFNKNFKDGYKSYCSPKCAQTDQSTKEKRKKTTLDKYGVDNVAKNKKIKKKTIETNLERYGTKSTFQNKEVKRKWKENIQEKYGVDHIFQLDEVKDKIQHTMKEKYGDHYTKTDHYTQKLKDIGFIEIIRKNKIDKHKDFFKKHGYEFLEIINHRYFKLKQGDDVFEIYWETFINRLENGFEISTNKNPLKFNGTSGAEEQLAEWVKSLGFNIDTSNRKFLGGKEVDILIHDKKLAIEFNGLYWHSEEIKGKKYHIEKTNSVKNLGYDLIHIWEDDWEYKKDIVKSIIKNRLGIIENKVYARKCEIKEVNFKTSCVFLDENHIQGKSNSKYRYGLYYKNELVSLMTFSSVNKKGKKIIELTRFCNKKDFSVIGASSKLFKHYLKSENYLDQPIISYSDIAMFTGKVYEKLNFKNEGNTSLNYWWVIDRIREHRFKYRKDNLIKEGHNPDLTEREIMYSLGHYRIWGCGQIRWAYKKL